MIRYDLTGKTALVTGGASGIGFATAKMLAGFGATVAVNFLTDDPRGPEAVDKLISAGGKAIMAPGSVWYLRLADEHSIVNGGTRDRVHLVIDCTVDDWLLGKLRQGV